VAVVSSCCSVAALLVEVAVTVIIVIVVLGRLGADDWNEVSCSSCFVLFEVQQKYDELSVLHFFLLFFLSSYWIREYWRWSPTFLAILGLTVSNGLQRILCEKGRNLYENSRRNCI
jgi:hypothetical protein